jgi:hypothetical protein
LRAMSFARTGQEHDGTKPCRTLAPKSRRPPQFRSIFPCAEGCTTTAAYRIKVGWQPSNTALA